MIGTARNRRIAAAALAGLASIAAAAPAAAGSVANNTFMTPTRDVRLRCPPLRHEIHCSISRMANPAYRSYCFYVGADGRSYPMKKDYRFGFSNPILHLRVRDGMRVTGLLTELKSGVRATCSEYRPRPR